MGPAGRRPPDRLQVPGHRRGLRARTTAADAAAGGAVRDRAAVHPAGRPLRPDPGPHEPLLGPHPADRQAGEGHPSCLSPGGLRPERGGGPARAADRQGRRPPGAGPLSGGPGPQTRCLSRFDRSRTGPLGRQVHPGPRRLVDPGHEDPRRAGRHPRAHRGAAARTPHDARACRRRPGRSPAGRGHDRGCRRVGGPQGRPGRDRARTGCPDPRPAVGDRDVPARVAPGASSAGHQAAASVSHYDQLLRRRRTSGSGHREGEAQ